MNKPPITRLYIKREGGSYMFLFIGIAIIAFFLNLFVLKAHQNVLDDRFSKVLQEHFAFLQTRITYHYGKLDTKTYYLFELLPRELLLTSGATTPYKMSTLNEHLFHYLQHIKQLAGEEEGEEGKTILFHQNICRLLEKENIIAKGKIISIDVPISATSQELQNMYQTDFIHRFKTISDSLKRERHRRG